LQTPAACLLHLDAASCHCIEHYHRAYTLRVFAVAHLPCVAAPVCRVSSATAIYTASHHWPPPRQLRLTSLHISLCAVHTSGTRSYHRLCHHHLQLSHLVSHCRYHTHLWTPARSLLSQRLSSAPASPIHFCSLPRREHRRPTARCLPLLLLTGYASPASAHAAALRARYATLRTLPHSDLPRAWVISTISMPFAHRTA